MEGGDGQRGLLGSARPRAPRGHPMGSWQSRRARPGLQPVVRVYTPALRDGSHVGCTELLLAQGLGECKCLQGSVQLARPPWPQEAKDPTGSGAPPPKKERDAVFLIFKENFES